ncbi:hypothetical protein AAIH46_13240 [Rhizobium sp. 0TCS1.26]|uniref:hypothetical protein n=1 Tax=Rhizobium sp. 0TCS1.26 TaxID=3142623 RepID=UPI003D2CE268
MAIDPAILDALDAVLARHPEQSEDFRKRFRTLVQLVVEGNFKDADIRRVMDLVAVDLERED